MYNVPLNGKGHVAPVSIEPNPSASTGTLQDEYVLSVKDLVAVFWRRLWVIALVAVVLAGGVVGFDLLRTPTYEASIKILVGQEGSTQGNLQGEVIGLQQITKTMAEAVETRPVAQAVIRELDLGLSPEGFLKNLSVEQNADTQFIEVSYRDASPAEARQIANTIGDVFSDQVSEVSPSTNAITATVWEQAATPEAPVSPNPLRDGILALVLGGMLGVGLAFLLEHLDDSWRSPEEVEQVSGVPNFAVIPEIKAPKSKKGGD